MCEYAPDCSKSDHPLAAALWERRKHAALIVRCPPERHPLAAVFDLPDTGESLVLPGYRMLRRSIFVDSRPGHDLERPDELHHAHAAIIPLSEYATGEAEHGRCRCGTWGWEPQRMMQRRFGVKHGQPYTLGNYVETADHDTRKWHG